MMGRVTEEIVCKCDKVKIEVCMMNHVVHHHTAQVAKVCTCMNIRSRNHV